MGELVLVVLVGGGARGSLEVSFEGLEELADPQTLFTVGSPADVCRGKRCVKVSTEKGVHGEAALLYQGVY